MKLIHLLFLFMAFFYCNFAFADCDDSPGPCWVTTLAVVGAAGGGVLNAASIGFNIVNTTNPPPQSLGRSFR
jgi:hypothetical protein